MFLSPFVGYTVSAILSNLIHQTLGRRGITIIAPTCHVIAFAVISAHPPFPVLVIMYILVGLGSGFHNAAWNVWIGNMANSHEVLGFFHGFYGVGATISPLVATSLIIKAGWEWYSYYYLMVSRSSLQPLDIYKLTIKYRLEQLLSPSFTPLAPFGLKLGVSIKKRIPVSLAEEEYSLKHALLSHIRSPGYARSSSFSMVELR